MSTAIFIRKLMTWFVIGQLLIGSVPFAPVQSVAWAETCSSGLEFNSILGRCLSTEQASQVAQASQQCESQATEAAKKQCYAAAAEGRLKDAEAKGEISEAGKVKGGGISTILVLGGLAASVGFLITNKGDCPGAMSAYMIAGGSAAVLAGEILAKREYKKKMEQAQEKLKAINESSTGTTSTSGATSEVVNATNVQVEAFDALIMQEDAVIAASKTKKKLYMLASAAYAAATVMAGLEWIKGPAAVCKSASTPTTETPKPVNQAANSTAEGKAATVAGGGLKKLFAMPATRTALAGVLTANNVFMIGKIGKEEKKAKERKEFLEKLRDQVMAAGTSFSCSSADRSNPGNLNCYCYSSDGKLNPARNNSQVCSALFNGANLASTSYSTGSGEAIPNFCTSSTGTLDETCSCKSTNTCLSLNGLSGNLGASGINLGSIPTTLNSVNSGSLNAASLDEGALGSQAAKLTTLAKQIESKNAKIADANKKAKQQAEAVLKSAASSAPADSGFGSSGSSFGEASLAASSPQEALAAIKQEIGRVETATSGASGTRSADDTLDFGIGGGGPSGGVQIDESQLAAVMENAMATGNSDINTSNGNIFQILSNRYQSSGMRRLFGDQSLPAEKANESEISR